MAVESLRRSAPTLAERYILGVDIGQSNDPTAIACIRWHRDRDGEHFDVVHLERRLGMPYPEMAGYVGGVLRRPPLDAGAELVIDQTGVGAPVGDIFEAAGLLPVRVSITSGAEETRHANNRWSVPKATLVSTLDARLHTGELRFAEALTDAGALREELKDFRRMVTAAGRASWSARAGAHDDLVLAVALGVWWAARRYRMLDCLGGDEPGYLQRYNGGRGSGKRSQP